MFSEIERNNYSCKNNFFSVKILKKIPHTRNMVDIMNYMFIKKNYIEIIEHALLI